LEFGRAKLGRELKSPVCVGWGEGFSPVQVGAKSWWRLCSNPGLLTFYNPTGTPRKVRISMVLASQRDCPLVFHGASFHTEFNAGPKPLPFAHALTIAPGSDLVTVSTASPPFEAPPRNPRVAGFRIINFMIEDQDASPDPTSLAGGKSTSARR
jgi:hypothetical protein